MIVTLARKRQALGRIVEMGPGSIIQFEIVRGVIGTLGRRSSDCQRRGRQGRRQVRLAHPLDHPARGTLPSGPPSKEGPRFEPPALAGGLVGSFNPQPYGRGSSRFPLAATPNGVDCMGPFHPGLRPP